MATKIPEQKETQNPGRFMEGAVPCNLFQSVLEEIREERNSRLIDPYALERGQTRSILGSQIVGAEDYQMA